MITHHIDEDKKNNTEENLATLCRRCHQGYHASLNEEVKTFISNKIKEKIK